MMPLDRFSLFPPAQWAMLATSLTLAVLLYRTRRELVRQLAKGARERRLNREMEAYARLDPGLHASADLTAEARRLARRVCLAIAGSSAFPSNAALLRDADGTIFCAGSAGMDDLTIAALHRWAAEIVKEERTGGLLRTLSGASAFPPGALRIAHNSFSLQLGTWEEFDPEISVWKQSGRRERRQFRRANATPMRTRAGRLIGILVVAGEMSAEDRPLGIERAMGPIEMLAQRVSTAVENAAMAERLLRAEKLAGLGQLAGGVAHALNNPLTAVLGFSELIGETAIEPRVRKDAKTIAAEALKMRDTVQRLIDFWRPVTPSDEPVDLPAVLRDLVIRCAPTLERRGVAVCVTSSDTAPPLRGSHDRLREVLEHLLNNAAQAIASAPVPPATGEPHTIRITLSHDDAAIHIIVSDTGPGFAEPRRVFDPFYTTRDVAEGAGLGLSICYGIVREHGGEINAFNLHPHGAAVVVELPLRAAADGVLVREAA